MYPELRAWLSSERIDLTPDVQRIAKDFDLGEVTGALTPIDFDPIHLLMRGPSAWKFTATKDGVACQWAVVFRRFGWSPRATMTQQRELIRLESTDVPAVAPMRTTLTGNLTAVHGDVAHPLHYSVQPYVHAMPWTFDSPAQAGRAGKSLGTALAAYHLTTAKYDSTKGSVIGTVWGDATPANALLQPGHRVTLADFEAVREDSVTTDLTMLAEAITRLPLEQSLIDRLQTSWTKSYFETYRAARRSELAAQVRDEFVKTPEFGILPKSAQRELMSDVPDRSVLS